jgi:hypothetical protein
VGDPGAGAGPHDRLERGDEPARRELDAHQFIVPAHVDVRLPVGHRDDALPSETPLQHPAKPLRRPSAAMGLLLGREGCHELTDIGEHRPEVPVRLGACAPSTEDPGQQPAQLGGPGAPREAGGEQRGHRRGEPDQAEGHEQCLARRRGPPVHEGHVVDEHQMAGHGALVAHRDPAHVDVAARHANVLVEALREIRPRRALVLAAGLGGEVADRRQCVEFRIADGGGDQPFVPDQGVEQRPASRPVARGDVPLERLARAGQDEPRARPQVPLGPGPRTPGGNGRRAPGDERQEEEQRNEEAKGESHGQPTFPDLMSYPRGELPIPRTGRRCASTISGS